MLPNSIHNKAWAVVYYLSDGCLAMPQSRIVDQQFPRFFFVAYKSTEQGERFGSRETYTKVAKKQRLAVCRILLDVMEGACEVRGPDLIMRTHYYPALQREMYFVGRDWEEVRDLSVPTCLVLSKELHYKVKVMIDLVAHDLYSRESLVSYQQRLSFDVPMSAIDWPVSFKEITLFAPPE